MIVSSLAVGILLDMLTSARHFSISRVCVYILLNYFCFMFVLIFFQIFNMYHSVILIPCEKRNYHGIDTNIPRGKNISFPHWKGRGDYGYILRTYE